MVDHKAVMSVADIRHGYREGFLCSCGRTILGKAWVDDHFVGRPMSASQLHYRRLEAFGMHIGVGV